MPTPLATAGSELEPGLASRIGESLNPTMILVASAVEDHRTNASSLGTLGNRTTDNGRGVLIATMRAIELASDILLGSAGSGQGTTLSVVDHLSIDMLVAAEDAQPRTRALTQAVPDAIGPTPSLLAKCSL